MRKVYGVASRKGGQGKSTTVSTLARLCAISGARVLVIDLAQPGTLSASLRDIWPEANYTPLSAALLRLRHTPPQTLPSHTEATDALTACQLPVQLKSKPSWTGGAIGILPWDEFAADAAAFVQSEFLLKGILTALSEHYDIALIDYPAEGGPLLTNALAATESMVLPLVPETPALEGAEALLRLMARARANGLNIELDGILLTQCDPRNRRVAEIVQTVRQAGTVEGEPLSEKVYPFAVRTSEFFEQGFRYGEPVWGRAGSKAPSAAYVILARRLLYRAGLAKQANSQNAEMILDPDTRIFDISALILDDPEVRWEDFSLAHRAELW